MRHARSAAVRRVRAGAGNTWSFHFLTGGNSLSDDGTTMDKDCTVLVIEDDDDAREALCEFLGTAGYRARPLRNGVEALAALANSLPNAVLLDLVIPEPDGFEVLRRIRERDPRVPVIVMSALSQAEDVVRAMKLGANDYLPKPFDVSELNLVLRRALDGPGRRPADVAETRAAAVVESGDGDLLPTTPLSGPMERVWALVNRIADTDVPVLLIGESGVGKDVIARRIHATSHRSARPFVKINCAALPGELLESELFGHEKGAFTGAHAEKPGKFELAHRGTIFLDEIGEMDPRLQAKLLQVLQDEEFYRVEASARCGSTRASWSRRTATSRRRSGRARSARTSSIA
jgi:two-component system response regulator AtoC